MWNWFVDDPQEHDWNSVNWNDLVPRLLMFAETRLRSHAHFCTQTDLAYDLVQNAIAKALSGDRKWNEDKCTIVQFFMGAIRSELSNLTRKGVARFDCVDGIYMLYKAEMRNHGFSPEDFLLCEDAKEKFLLAMKYSDPEVTYLASLMFYDGFRSPKDIAEHTELTIDKVNRIKRRLKRKVIAHLPPRFCRHIA